MFRTVPRFARIAAIVAIAAATALATFDDANARRAGGFGSFGSRGTRTFQAPPVTSTAPTQAAPINRTMTSRPDAATQPGFNAPQRPGLFNGFGRSMIGGLIAGGLLGMLIGHGFGGGFGFLGMLLQVILIGMAISFALRYFANRRQPSYASQDNRSPYAANDRPSPSFTIPGMGGGAPSYGRSNTSGGDDIGLTQADLNRFEQLLTEVQTAYGAEDYATLRRLTTPEAMSYLAEELGETATRGLRNQVTDVHLLQGDIAEAWRDGNMEFATLAMRYSSIDALVDRNTGKLVEGDDRRPSESTEIWTFVRRPGAAWQLSAIQSTDRHAA